MYYVYLLRSIKNPSETYIGYTGDLEERIKTHNSGQCHHILIKINPGNWLLM